MIINRTFSHKTGGIIGEVSLDVGEGVWKLDGKELPEVSKAALVRHALQMLQDAYGGADKTMNERRGAYGKKYDQLVNGTIGERGGSGLDPYEQALVNLVHRAIKASGDKATWKAWLAMGTTEQLATADKYRDNFADDIDGELARMEAESERKRVEAEAAAKLAGKVKISL